MTRYLVALLCSVFLLAFWAAEAVSSTLDDKAEQRMMAIAMELRCLVCQNESIAGSRADLAVDLRQQIREQIAAGRSDQQILSYMVDRYGDFVRYRPPLKGVTIFLWFGPLVLLVTGFIALTLHLRRRSSRADDSPLSDDEKKRAESLLQHTLDTRK